MTLGYLVGATISAADPRHGAAMHAAFPAFRAAYEEAEGHTGIPAATILRGDFRPANQREKFSMTGIRLAALAFGTYDVLAEREIQPGAVGGVSLGGLISSVFAGAVSRADLYRLLVEDGRMDDPRLDPPAEAVAIAFVPAADQPAWYYGDNRPGIHLGGDFGLMADGSRRVLMLSGLRSALTRLADTQRPGVVNLIEGQTLAVHSPLRQVAQEAALPFVAATPMRDPAIPLCSFLERRTLTTAADVRDLFARNKTHTMSLVHVNDELAAHGTRLGFALGPALQVGALSFPFPVVQINDPGQLDDAMTAIYEHGVELSAPA